MVKNVLFINLTVNKGSRILKPTNQSTLRYNLQSKNVKFGKFAIFFFFFFAISGHGTDLPWLTLNSLFLNLNITYKDTWYIKT